MPAGYTSGILDGSIETFEDYAKECMRAFGATYHMRDEPHDKPWEPIEPSEYHKNRLDECKQELDYYQTISDEELIQKEKIRVLDEIILCCNSLMERIENRNLLEKFKKKAEDWEPPEGDYDKYKEFMIEQLNKTIGFDCDDEGLWLDWLKREMKSFSNTNADSVREERIESAEKDIKHHKEKWEQEVENAENKNKWVRKLLEEFE